MTNLKGLMDIQNIRKNERVVVEKSKFNNGIIITIDGIKIGIDHWNSDCDILFISHAHMDHIPYIPDSITRNITNNEHLANFPQIICSKITNEIAKFRTKEKFIFPKSNWLLGYDLDRQSSAEFKGIKIKMLVNGHTYGSSSLLIEGSESILYTSEFISEDRCFKNGDVIECLKPRKCDNLILDCTFCSPRFNFPPFNDVKYKTNELVEKEFNDGNTVIFFGYTFGKSQIILKILEDDSKIFLDKQISKIIEILEDFNIKFPNWDYFNRNIRKKIKKDDPILIISPPNNLFKDTYTKIINKGSKTAIFSGKVLDASFRAKMKVDNYISLSDHSDFKSTLRFINRCDPSTIFLEYGLIENFSYFLSKHYNDKSILIIP